jgi:Family of unknown function (DUF6527)
VKIRLAEGWNGLSNNGGPLDADEFAYIVGSLIDNPSQQIKEIKFPCPGHGIRKKGKAAFCVLRIRRGDPEPSGLVFGWNGNLESPTLMPSIGCDQRCGWHGHLTNGELIPTAPDAAVDSKP